MPWLFLRRCRWLQSNQGRLLQRSQGKCNINQLASWLRGSPSTPFKYSEITAKVNRILLELRNYGVVAVLGEGEVAKVLGSSESVEESEDRSYEFFHTLQAR